MKAVKDSGSFENNRLWTDAEYWEKAWQRERRSSLFGIQQPERSGWEWWDQRADGFANRTGGESERQRQAGIIQLLDQYHFLEPDIEVLDIGCGPGNYALQLARRVKKVVALDPSPRMLAILQQRAAEEGITNIETICLTWEEVDLEELGWKDCFGLVIAAMTPGINDGETLKKMVVASNRGCYYNGFASCDEPLQNELWRHLFQREMPPFPADLFYIFHLLYAWGYCPSLELKRRYSRREMTSTEAVEWLSLAMAPYLEITEQIRNEIIKVVGKISEEGGVYKERQIVEGSIIWDVNS